MEECFSPPVLPSNAELAPSTPGQSITTSGLQIVNQEGKIRATLSLWNAEPHRPAVRFKGKAIWEKP